jgi:hypothetical protein
MEENQANASMLKNLGEKSPGPPPGQVPESQVLKDLSEGN